MAERSEKPKAQLDIIILNISNFWASISHI
jgi:hypothetical protein